MKAVVIQGKYYNEFTDKIVSWYNSELPDWLIVISCWEDCKIAEKNYETKNINILRNRYPILPGPQNINYQVTTTLAAINYLIKKGCSIVAKTRSDHFIKNIKNLVNLSLDKIVVLKTNNFSNEPFFICDFFYCGPINKIFWHFNLALINEPDDRPCFNNPNYYLNMEWQQIRLKRMMFAEKILAWNYFVWLTGGKKLNWFAAHYKWYKYLFVNYVHVPVSKYECETIKRYRSLSYIGPEEGSNAFLIFLFGQVHICIIVIKNRMKLFRFNFWIMVFGNVK